MTIKTTATYLLPDEVYLVIAPYTIHKIFVGELELPPRTREFVVKSLDEITVEIKKSPEVTHFKNDKDQILSIQDHQSQLEQLISLAEPNDYDGLDFQNLEDEYAYKKFIRDWKPQYSEDINTERELLEIDVTEIRLDSGDPDIVSLWNSSMVENYKKLYCFDREEFCKKTLKKLCLEKNLHIDFGGKYTDIKFVKIENSYVLTKCNFLLTGIFKGSLENAKKQKEQLLEKITTIVNLCVAKRDHVEFYSQADLLIELKDIQTLLSQKQRNTYNKFEISISNLITKMEKKLNELS